MCAPVWLSDLNKCHFVLQSRQEQCRGRGARDPDQMSLMSIPSASSSSTLAISSHSSAAILHGGFVHVRARQASMKVLAKDTLEVYKDDVPYLEQE